MNNGRQRPAVAAQISALRDCIAAIEQGPARAQRGGTRLTMGVENIDAILPGGGLARDALHEVVGRAGYGRALDGAALAFAAVLAARQAAAGCTSGTNYVLWCLSGQGLYGPGLAAFGLTPERLILVRGRDDQQRLWAMEEGLKCPDLAMVVGEVGRLDLGQSRRLQLAAEASGVTALQGGQIDMTSTAPAADVSVLMKDDAIKVLRQPGLNTRFISVNLRKAPFDDIHVRRAFSMAFQREAMVQAGGPVTMPLPSCRTRRWVRAGAWRMRSLR